MTPDLLSLSPSRSRTAAKPRLWRAFLRSNGSLKICLLSTAFTGLIVYLAFLPPHDPLWRLPDWQLPSHFDSHSLEHADSKAPSLQPTPTPKPKYIILDGPSPPSPSSPESDVLSPEQIRDIVAPTRGFFSRDYSMSLGWNNLRYIIEASLLQAALLNRTLVLPSFFYSRACEYEIAVCADYTHMVNKGDVLGSDDWRELPIEQQMGFRIPISVIVNVTHLRNRQPVITVSEYLRLHGQDPTNESSDGFWPRESYHTHPNVFETNKTKTPSLFVIKNHWYEYGGTLRVNYLPEAMKKRGNLERIPRPEDYDIMHYWPPLERTELSRSLSHAIPWDRSVMPWNTAVDVLKESLGGMHLDDDKVVEQLLNAHGWEVLHTFEDVGADPTRTIVNHRKEVAQRSSLRGFRDDYYDLDADVVVLAGEIHSSTRPGGMRFTEEIARNRFASAVLHLLIPPQKIFDLAEVLSFRMLLRTEGRSWMGAHIRRGDFIQLGWAMEMDPEAHVQRVKDRLSGGRTVLAHLHNYGDWTTYDIDGVQPDPEQSSLRPPHAEDPFFVATDERDPDALWKIAGGGAIFLSDLLTMEDRQAFGWQLMITDVAALVEQQVLVRSGFFYGHCLSSFAGAVVNMRAGRGADPRTVLLD